MSHTTPAEEDGALPGGLGSVDEILTRYLPAPELAACRRILYGHNCGAPLQEDVLLPESLQAARGADFDLKGCFVFRAAPMQLRAPRVVRIAVIQNKIVLPTTAPYADQAKASALPWVHAWMLVQVQCSAFQRG